MTKSENKTGAKKTKKSSLWEYVGAILVVLGVHIFVYQPYTIPSGSMIPTLLIGDYIFVNKFAYGYSRYSVFFQPKCIKGRIHFKSPKRGEVAVFFHPFTAKDEAQRYDRGMFGGALQRGWRSFRETLGIPQEGVNYVKRVIGLPGDKIQMIKGRLHINGEKLPLAYQGEYPISKGDDLYVAKKYTETLPNGKEHPILKIFEFGKAHLDNTKEFIIPAGHYFMMGDNRDDSLDSRATEEVGFISEDRFVGRPDLIFFSTEAKLLEIHKWLFVIRYSRLFHIVK